MAESKTMKRIKRMARLAGINPGQKTITNVRLFMEIYLDINHEADHFKTMAKPISATEACPLLFAELLRPDEIDEETNGEVVTITAKALGDETDKWIEILVHMDRTDLNNERAETRRHVSIDEEDPEGVILPQGIVLSNWWKTRSL